VVSAMWDSTLVKNMEPVGSDSLVKNRDIHYALEKKLSRTSDSISGDPVIQIFFQASGDPDKGELAKALAPGIRSIQAKRTFTEISDEEGKKQAHNFVIRLGPDTLNMDSLRISYREALQKAGIETPFVIKHVRTEPGKIYGKFTSGNAGTVLMRGDGTRGFSTANRTEDSEPSNEISITPLSSYQVTHQNVNLLVFNEILPQILFSVLLTLIIAMAFLLMYRSMRSQQKLVMFKNDFINNMSHELKTPVATVSVAIEALKNFRALDNPERTHEYLEIAQNELNRLTIMTDKILKTSAFENGEMNFKPEKLNLDGIILRILGSLKVVFEKKNASVNYEKEGEDFNLEGSQVHLTNVIYNLIDNALKYSVANPAIGLRLTGSKEKLILMVKDNGPGIPAEYQKKIFEKFFRIPAGDVHNAKGYGLGLSYVASVVKSHHGTVAVDSAPGEGTCFTVAFPKELTGKTNENKWKR